MKKNVLLFIIILQAIILTAQSGDAFIFGERILSLMQKSVPESERDIVRKSVALLYAQTDYEEEGIASLMTIRNESEYIPAVMTFTNIMAGKFNFKTAKKSVSLLKGEYKLEAMLVIADEMINSGITNECGKFLEGCESAIDKDFEPYKTSKFLSELSTLYYRLNNTPKALELISRALWTAQSIKDGDKKAFALKDVSLAYISMNNRLITGIVENQINQTKNQRTLLEIAKDYLEAGEVGGTKKFLKTAKARTEKENDLKMKSGQFYEAAVLYKKIKSEKDAAECAKMSLSTAKVILSRNDRINAMIRANDILKEDSVYSTALQEILLVKDYKTRVDMIIDISSGYMRMNAREKGFFLLKMILVDVKKNKKILQTEKVLESISDIYIDNGSSRECDEFIDILKRDFSEYPLIISKMYHANNSYKSAIKYAERIKDSKKRSLQKIKITEMVFSASDKQLSQEVLSKMLYEISLSEDALFKCILLADVSILCIKYQISLDRESLSLLEKI
ncbi:MAG: hypothetical protein AB7T10_09135 [bacterium]